MPTVFTHAIVGATLGCARQANIPRAKLMFVLVFLSVMPDLDVIGFWPGIDYADPMGHRGFTHSITFAFLAGLITASLLFRSVRILSGAWWLLFGLCFLATSPLSISAFFEGPALEILANEIKWIGFPLLLIMTIFYLIFFGYRKYFAKAE